MPEALNLPWLNYLLVNAPDEYFGGFSWFDYPHDMKPGILRSRKLCWSCSMNCAQRVFQRNSERLADFPRAA